MNISTKTAVDDATRDVLAVAVGDGQVLAEALEARETAQHISGLDPVSFALVKVAALIALDAPPVSYPWQVGNALDAGATPAGNPRRAAGGRAPGRRAPGSRGRSRDHPDPDVTRRQP
jgi:hypothetical protein